MTFDLSAIFCAEIYASHTHTSQWGRGLRKQNRENVLRIVNCHFVTDSKFYSGMEKCPIVGQSMVFVLSQFACHSYP